MRFCGKVLESLHRADDQPSARVGEVQLTGQRHNVETVGLYRSPVRGVGQEQMFFQNGKRHTLVAQAVSRLRCGTKVTVWCAIATILASGAMRLALCQDRR